MTPQPRSSDWFNSFDLPADGEFEHGTWAGGRTSLVSRRFRVMLITIIVLGLALLLGLAFATRSTASFADNYTIVLLLNLVIIITMVVVLLLLAYWLYLRWRHNAFGTRLLTRFAFSFVILAVVPSILLVFISNLFVSRTIDSWFSLKLDSALTAGIDFGHDRLQYQSSLAQSKLREWAQQHGGRLPIGAPQKEVSDWLNKGDWRVLMVLDGQGKVLWRVNQVSVSPADVDAHLPDLSANALQRLPRDWVEAEDEFDQVNSDDGESAGTPPRQYLHVMARVEGVKHSDGVRWLYGQKIMPLGFSQRVDHIQNGLRDYQATEASRDSLRTLYRITLSITLLVTLLAALAAAFLIADRMIQPILWLARATRQVAQGHYALIPPRAKGSDEMLQLVDSFGDMAQQLNVTQTSLVHNQHELESAKAYLEAVLDNLSAAVLVFDQNLHLLSYNQTTERVFHASFAPYLNTPLQEIEPLSSLTDTIQEQTTRLFAQHLMENDGHQTSKENQPSSQTHVWRVQQSLKLTPHANETMLSIQGSRFLDQDGTHSWVLVCDDVTPIISAQRTLAWGEVARRLAHEIKNPLTPIQLSAERLQVKLSGLLDAAAQTQLEKGTRTIINQVSALQNMVDEFRDYARMPSVRFAAVDLNRLIEEILLLYDSGQNHLYLIQAHLSPHLPSIWADEQQLRQVLHNLIKNAIEAHIPRTDGDEQGLARIDISTELTSLAPDDLVAARAVRLTISDNGSGFSETVLARMFEPYHSTKAHGTGLGLPIVKKILDAHGAQIRVINRIEKKPETKILGAQIGILFMNLVESAPKQGGGQSEIRF